VGATKERWNEQEAILLLQGAAKLVQEIETSGTRMPHSEREQYHARLVAAHDARDMAAYRIALEGYAQGARKAYRKMKPGTRKREEG
jgi:DNA-binding FadR family transcriptional regulator